MHRYLAICVAGMFLASCSSGVSSEPDELIVLDCRGTDTLVSTVAPHLAPVQRSYAFNPKKGQLLVFSDKENNWTNACQTSNCSISITRDTIRVQTGFIDKETSYWIDRRNGRWSSYSDGVCSRVEADYSESEQLF